MLTPRFLISRCEALARTITEIIASGKLELDLDGGSEIYYFLLYEKI